MCKVCSNIRYIQDVFIMIAHIAHIAHRKGDKQYGRTYDRICVLYTIYK